MHHAVQTSILPTRKLATGALVASIVGQAYAGLLEALAASVSGPVWGALLDVLASPEASALVAALAALAIGWFVPDRPNVPVSILGTGRSVGGGFAALVRDHEISADAAREAAIAKWRGDASDEERRDRPTTGSPSRGS